MKNRNFSVVELWDNQLNDQMNNFKPSSKFLDRFLPVGIIGLFKLIVYYFYSAIGVESLKGSLFQILFIANSTMVKLPLGNLGQEKMFCSDWSYYRIHEVCPVRMNGSVIVWGEKDRCMSITGRSIES